MAVPDEAMLTAQERAALAALESRAVADDPRLALHLRRGLLGGGGSHSELARVASVIDARWQALHAAVIGPLLLVAGVALVVLGLGVGLAVQLVGVALTTLGVALASRVVAGWLDAARDAAAADE